MEHRVNQDQLDHVVRLVYLDLRDQMEDLVLEELMELVVRRAIRVKRDHVVIQVQQENLVDRENQALRDHRDQQEMTARREDKVPLGHLAKRETEDLKDLLDHQALLETLENLVLREHLANKASKELLDHVERRDPMEDEDPQVPKDNQVYLVFQAPVDRKENAVHLEQRAIVDHLVHVELGDQQDQRGIKEKSAILVQMVELVKRVTEDQRETLELLE